VSDLVSTVLVIIAVVITIISVIFVGMAVWEDHRP